MLSWTLKETPQNPMAKKKQDELTPRQRQSQQIMREKASRKKRRVLVRRARIYGGIVICTIVFVGGAWLLLSGAGAQMATGISNGAYAMTARAGFSVQGIYLEGRNRTLMRDIEQALDIQRGESIFKVDIDDVRARLEEIPSVRTAAVERALPHTLYVRVAEREPVALWQQEGKMALVDEKGKVMADIDITPYQSLPLIIGEGAPRHVAEVISILASEPELAHQFAAAIRVGDRRWNIRMQNGTEIKLPEHKPLAAWKKIAELQSSQKLLERTVKMVDMRIEGRLFITVHPQEAQQSKSVGAKDT
jgi:cell division protein FtsQ